MHFRTMGMDQLAPVAREIAEVAHLDGRDEAAPEEAMLQEFSDPTAILHVCLASRDLFDVGRIAEQDGEVPFEHIENRLPIHTRRFHGDDRTPMGLEPRTHGQYVMSHGAKGAHLVLALSLVVMPDQADFDVLFVDIHTRTRLMHNMHGGFLSARRASAATHALRRISSKDKSPPRSPRVGETVR